MKPCIKILLVFLFFILFPQKIEARSGCCSGHSGVDCGAGAQSNGNVICNDGWRGSSCSYSGMVMCGGVSTQTVQPNPTSTPVPTRIIPTNTPKPTLIPTNAPVILGTETKNTTQSSNSNGLGILAIWAWIFYGGYKLVKKFKNSTPKK